MGVLNIFVKTAIVTIFVFGAGIGLGLLLGGERITSLEESTIDLQISLEDVELEFLFLDVMKGNISCNYFIKEAESLGSISDEMGREVEKYEGSDKLREGSFVELKERYTSVLIRNWLTLEKIKSTCNGSYTTILYFYTQDDCNKCGDQGVILSYLKDRLDGELMIFAVDGDVDLRIVRALKEAYSIEEYPTLVINGEISVGFHEMDELTDILCEYNKNLEIC